MKTLRNAALITAAVGMLAAASMQASAQSSTRVVAPSPAGFQKRVVSYADLDLKSLEGQQALHYRISNAAEYVCGASDLKRAGSLARAARNTKCHEQSISRALSKISVAAAASLD